MCFTHRYVVTLPSAHKFRLNSLAKYSCYIFIILLKCDSAIFKSPEEPRPRLASIRGPSIMPWFRSKGCGVLTGLDLLFYISRGWKHPSLLCLVLSGLLLTYSDSIEMCSNARALAIDAIQVSSFASWLFTIYLQRINLESASDFLRRAPG